MTEEKPAVAIELEESYPAVKTESEILVYLKQLLYIVAPRLYVLYVFLVSLELSSIIGLLLLLLLIISMYIENKRCWRDVWIPASSGSIVIIIFQIVYLFNKAKNVMDVDEVTWIGLGSSTSSVLYLIFWLLSVVGFGIFSWYTQKWEYYLVSDEALFQMEKRFYSLFYPKTQDNDDQRSESSMRQSESIFGRRSSVLPSDVDDIDEEEREALKKEFKNLRPLYYGKKIEYVATQLYHIHGYEIALFLLVILAFYRLNVVSVLYVILASAFSYFSHYFNHTGAVWIRKINRLKWAWRIVYTFTAIDVLRQYFILKWFPDEWGISSPLQNSSFGCNPAAESVYSTIYEFSGQSDYTTCIDNFENWLTISSFDLFDITINFICLFKLMCYDNYFFPISWQSDKKHKEGDEDDFTRRPTKNFANLAKFFIFCYFHQIALVAFVFVGLRGNVQGSTDLIGIFYIFVGIYLIYYNKLVIMRANRIWVFIEIANCAVMLALVIYQAPWFYCPIKVEGRYYFSNEECLYIQSVSTANSATVTLEDAGIVDKLLVLIGINKLEQNEILGNFRVANLILFFLLAFVQRKIWNHVYMKAYVEPYIRRDQFNHERRGVSYIEKEHIKRISAYRNLLLNKSFLKASEENINKKIMLWEKITLNESDKNFKYRTEENGLLQVEDDPDYNRRMKCLKRLEPRIRDKEIIDFDDLNKILERNNYDSKKCYEEVCAESRKTKAKIRNQLHDIKEINLPPLREVATRSLLTSVFKAQLEKVEEEEEKKGSEEEKKDFEEDRQEGEASALPLEEEKKIIEAEEEQEENVLESSHETRSLVEENISVDTIVRRYLVEHIRRAFSLDENADTLSEKASYGYLIMYFILSSWTEITYAMIILNFFIQPDLLSFFILFTVFSYAIVEYPTPSRKYWKFLIVFVAINLGLKYIFQLPFFCNTDSSVFAISYFGTDSSCPDDGQMNSLTGFLHLIGIKKFSDTAEGVLAGLASDFFTLLVLNIQRWILKKRGVWHHVALTHSREYVPQFEKSRRAKKKNHGAQQQQDEPQSPESQTKKPNIFKRFFLSIENFIFNLFPHNFGLEEVNEFNIIKKPGRNYYTPTVTFSVIITIYLLIFFTTLTGEGLTITESLDESSFSGGMVLSVMSAFVVMLFDRVLFISREDFVGENVQIAKLGFFNFFRYSFGLKVVLHYILTLVLLIWIYYEIGASTSTSSRVVIILFCILTAFFLYFSGSQVKWGYPLYSPYHAFQSTDLVTGLIFKALKNIPFLFEIGSFLDWTFTKTALDLFQWMKLEDAWVYLYLKSIENTGRKNNHFGSPKKKIEKCFLGCCSVFLITLILIGPLALFSSLNPNSVLNNIESGTFSISLMSGGSQSTSATYKIFEIENLQITNTTMEEFSVFQRLFTDLTASNSPQLQKIELNTYSDSTWDITPPNFNNLVLNLQSQTETFYINVEWEFTRASYSASGSNAVVLTSAMRNQLVEVLQSGSSQAFTINDLFPKYLHLTSATTTSLYETSLDGTTNYPLMISTSFKYCYENGTRYWLAFSLNSSDEYPDYTLFNSAENMIFYALCEKTTGSLFGTNLGDLGVITIYATFVYAIGTLLRSVFDRRSQRIIYEEIPDTREIMELMEAIYTARREKNTMKEHALYELLIRIYRSPDVILQLTGRIQKYADPLEGPNERPDLQRQPSRPVTQQATTQARREDT